MSFTNGDDPALDAEIEGRKHYRNGAPPRKHMYTMKDKDLQRRMNLAFYLGYLDEKDKNPLPRGSRNPIRGSDGKFQGGHPQ